MKVTRDDDGREVSDLLLFKQVKASNATFDDNNGVTYQAVIFTFLDDSDKKQELLVLKAGIKRLLEEMNKSVPAEAEKA